jgi:perosamine synthetase
MFWVEQIGYKYKMSNLQAALGVAQMERIEELVGKKREQFSIYNRAFSVIDGISLNPEPPFTKNSYWMPTIIIDKKLNINIEKLIGFMKENNIDIRNFFYLNSMFPMFEKKTENVISYDIYSRGINLPAYFDLTIEEQIYVIDMIKRYLNF